MTRSARSGSLGGSPSRIPMFAYFATPGESAFAFAGSEDSSPTGNVMAGVIGAVRTALAAGGSWGAAEGFGLVFSSGFGSVAIFAPVASLGASNDASLVLRLGFGSLDGRTGSLADDTAGFTFAAPALATGGSACGEPARRGERLNTPLSSGGIDGFLAGSTASCRCRASDGVADGCATARVWRAGAGGRANGGRASPSKLEGRAAVVAGGLAPPILASGIALPLLGFFWLALRARGGATVLQSSSVAPAAGSAAADLGCSVARGTAEAAAGC